MATPERSPTKVHEDLWLTGALLAVVAAYVALVFIRPTGEGWGGWNYRWPALPHHLRHRNPITKHVMQSTSKVSRRAMVMSVASVPAGLALGGLSGCKGEGQIDRALSFASLAQAEAELSALEAAKDVRSSATWTWAQTLEHCAQSIEYSMTGYPELKSKVFRSAIGPAALEFFSWRGRMTHDLAEPIPGAPEDGTSRCTEEPWSARTWACSLPAFSSCCPTACWGRRSSWAAPPHRSKFVWTARSCMKCL